MTITKMWKIWSLLLPLVLLSCCKADITEPIDSYSELFENIINSNTQGKDRENCLSPDSLQNLTAELNSLRQTVMTALSAIDQQKVILKDVIDTMLDKIMPVETQPPSTTPTKPLTEANEKSCGIGKVCVQKGLCKSENTDTRGNYIVKIAIISPDNPCHYLQVCCPTADKIESSPVLEPLGDDQYPDCGWQHVNGISMTLEDTPNREAEFGEFPWMVALMLASDGEPEYIGGGSLIASNVVLTAAHKVHKIDKNELVIRAGDWDLNSNLEIHPHVDSTVNQVLLHNRFIKNATDYNIALLVLTMPFNPKPHIAPICLKSSDESLDYSRCIVTGWGKSREDSLDYPHILKEVEVPILPRDNCNAVLSNASGKNFVLDQTSICAGGEKDADSCLGDGGSPLVCPIKGFPNRYFQAGIVAWGLGCGEEHIPSIYTNVPYLTQWITEELLKLLVDSQNDTLNNESPPIIRGF